jgi:mannose-6-phosphate isomerase-like protein (cupin superfamily)
MISPRRTKRSCKPMKSFITVIHVLIPLFVIPLIVYGQKNTTDSVTFYSSSTVDSLLNTKVSPERISRLLGRSADDAPYLVVTRNKPGDVEIHEQYDDVAIVRSGRGTLKTGYEITGQKESGKEPSREWLGGVIMNPKQRSLSPGDFIVIPAMMPHQYIPNDGETLTYWTIKVKASVSH